MRKDNPYEVTSDLASLGTIDRSTKKFEIITEEVARYGLASANRKLHV
ncbi:hypothetical protein [Pediococcus pentosaceus]|nr:hypothetical protein [Pediococcus pentosaceus]